jgi:hypothetical protein
VYLTDFVRHTGVKEDALGGGSLARVHVGADTNVAIAVERSLTCHAANLDSLNPIQKPA